ncbi:cobalamin biosynthesis protein CobQ [Actibacterium sp. 188UL27-1]|uniref:cobalamin biosynthesis protein CobQ n=1 Tax=Actibacterium sp. 188UL27-1 TaxID=2786961 RepID=UPI001957FA1A|nr:cobalamin biosynthesis protein CobQ [Actibacterium sp. 188UL27-1]MBM7068272.1 cobalamin biosynthesis protein CobQ [Actibacterium sp. 188UL27-1]
MNTPAHLIFGAAAFARPNAPAVTTAALAGAMLPDLSLYVLVGWHLLWLGTPAQVVFDQLYFSDAWMRIFRVDNSFILWGVGFAAALACRSRWCIALTGAALLHLALDFPLHHDDGRPQFWPLTNWIFESPVSYWDSRAYGNIVGPIEVVASLILCGVLWRRFKAPLSRAVIVLAVLTQISPVMIWFFVFANA